MPNSLFIDTSGWASIFIPTEMHHPIAAQHFRQAIETHTAIITTNYVITELVALLNSPHRLPRSRIFNHINIVRQNASITRIQIDPTLDQTAWELCQQRPDKPWSLVDCSSFVIMQQMNIQQALTTDHHFEQAGFIRLLKPI
ncbi:MAG: type II toxin-antitoxin system VapC family toxin [Alkalinema sp. RU_4_3]|nr:type II toxin-antitoxin system VapC family toxin [Alkalinema sp. RU_4_3]